MDPISFSEEILIDRDGNKYQIKDVVGMSFKISFEEPSRFAFALKKGHEGIRIFSRFALLIATLLFGVPLELYMAQYSILVVLLLLFGFFFKIVPIYWRIYKQCHEKGFKVFYFEDTVAFVAFQKKIWSHRQARHIAKRGFIFGEGMEQFMYTFVPSILYNSDSLRRWIGFVGQVIYPIVVILIPMVFGTTFVLAKILKHFIKSMRKDIFIRFLISNLDDILEIIEKLARSIGPTKLVIFIVEYAADLLLPIIFEVFRWLRTEYVLVIMQIDYFRERYVKVFKTLTKMYKNVSVWVEKLGFHKKAQPFIKGYKKIDNTLSPGLLKKTTNQIYDIKGNIEDVKEQIELHRDDKKNN
ncbi:unnamed protein product [Blepharisma stoltei]|uniref:Odorant receptor n=1 Tax=Blepharisma stoltei TaxID=1481888 RepID=A0AAU9J6F0_9CILI|nr:unnamed protein product [Blepharisma stoltei]